MRPPKSMGPARCAARRPLANESGTRRGSAERLGRVALSHEGGRNGRQLRFDEAQGQRGDTPTQRHPPSPATIGSMSRRDLAHVLTVLWDLSNADPTVGVPVADIDEAIGRGRDDMRTPLNLASLSDEGLVVRRPDGD